MYVRLTQGLSLVLVFMLPPVVGFAEEAQQEVASMPSPKFPLALRAPARSQWRIDFRYDREKAQKEVQNPEQEEQPGDDAEPYVPPPMMPKSIEVSKDGKIYREITTWPDGKKSEKWVLDGLQLREQRKTGRVLDIDAASYSTDFSDYRRSDFEVAEWLDQKNFKGVRMLGARPVYEFVIDAAKRPPTPREIALKSMADDTSEGVSETTAAAAGTYVAYVDTKSLLPLYFDDGEVVRIYSYAPLESALVVPQKFANRYNARKKLLEQKTRVPTPP